MENHMADTREHYGLVVHLDAPYEEAIARTTAALQAEGFGVLTEIDVKATMKKKLDVEFRPYVILGACNPALAHRGLTAEPELGLLLPCNVIVYADEDGTTVSIVDPAQMLSVAANPALEPIAGEARVRLQRVAAALAAA
jgi:uncharacterized protein (DUF302 family)